MLENLTDRLQGVIKNLRGQARLSEENIADAMREVRMALLEADVALPVVKDFITQVKLRAQGEAREELKRMADIFRGRIIDVSDKTYTIELTGDQSKNDACLDAIERSAILETVRTGSSGVGRGERILRV